MSDSLKELKKAILNDEKVEKLLEELGCEYIKLHVNRSGDDLVTAQLPDSDNKRSVQVYLNEELRSSIVNRGVSGDIYWIVGYILYGDTTFEQICDHMYQIKSFICNALDYDMGIEEFARNQIEKKKDWNSWLRPIQKERKRIYEASSNSILDESVLDEYDNSPWKGWIDEGISWKTQREFGIGYDKKSSRITIPIRNQDGNLIGVKGRYVGRDKEIRKDQKYLYLHPLSKNIELFNLDKAMEYIQKYKMVLVVEGAKTAIKMWEWGIRYAVSIEGDKLSPVQARILKGLGQDVEIIFCFDKDKDRDHVRQQIKQIKNRRVCYLYDHENLYSEKDSPTDRDKDTFKSLWCHGKFLLKQS